jgi:hypothetical protein
MRYTLGKILVIISGKSVDVFDALFIFCGTPGVAQISVAEAL